MIAPVLASQLRLGFGRNRTDHCRPQRLGPLTGDQTDSAGGGVDQDLVTALHRKGVAQQISRGQPLQHHCRAGSATQAVRQFEQAVRRHAAHLAIGTERAGTVGHAISRLDVRHAIADGLDHSSPFAPETGRQR